MRGWRALRRALPLGLIAWVHTLSLAAPLPVLTLAQAELTTETGGPPRTHGQIELPLHWDVSHGGETGRASLRMVFDAPAAWRGRAEPFAVFITRLGSAYELRLNGALLAQAGQMDRRNDAWSAKQPVTVGFPAGLLQERNLLELRLRVDAGRRSGLSVVRVGPAREIGSLASRADLARVVLPQAAAVFSLLVAVFCALLWWQHRDPLYAWAGLGEALWAVAVADTVIESAPFPWPWWGLCVLMSRALWSWSIYSVARQLFAPRPRGEAWLLGLVIASAPLVVLLALALRSSLVLGVYQAVHMLAWLVTLSSLGLSLLRQPRAERALFLLAILSCLVAGLRDAMAARWEASLYDESAWIKYVAVLVGATVMWIVSMRFRQARREVQQLNASLAMRVEQKEVALRDSFARLAEAERSRAVLAERERILRDMHDGVGAHLATAVRQLEGGRAAPDEVARTLRESMEHLKLSIDAMSLPAGDVNALLASLRYRLQPRIESAGVSLDWQVEALPAWPDGHDEAMRHLQFLLLEAISNCLQHAAASRLTLNARHENGHIALTLRDDGCGLGESSGRGLRFMHERAAAIGAELQLSSATPGTELRVLLPAPLLAAESGHDIAR
jgi:signal transduction histidine kinase